MKNQNIAQILSHTYGQVFIFAHTFLHLIFKTETPTPKLKNTQIQNCHLYMSLSILLGHISVDVMVKLF